MSYSSRRKIHLRHPAVVDIGCNCRKPKFSSLFSFSSPSKRIPNDPPSSSSITTYTSCSPPPPPQQQRRRRKMNGRVTRESVAVVKETSEPYSDFKESMVRMIVEKEIYGWDDLNDLLHCFLSLNAPRHHHLILRAFADLWNGVFSPPSPLSAGDDPPPPSTSY